MTLDESTGEWHGENALKAGFRRHNEIRLLRRKALVNCPRPSAIKDRQAFDCAVDFALGSDMGELQGLMPKATPKQLDAIAQAFAAVAEGRRGITKPDAHVVVLLGAKLILEQGMPAGELPTQKQVRAYAVKLIGRWFKARGWTTKETVTTWKDYFENAGLKYLPTDVRGPGK